MPTFGIFAPDWTALTKRPHRLRTTALTCLIAASPLFVNAEQPVGHETARLNVSRTDPLVLDEKIRAWFKEQDRILDEILLRLSRIEDLVRELHRMIQALPVGNMPVTETAPAIPATPSAAPVAAPAVAPPPAPIATAPAAKPPVIPHPVPVPAVVAPARVAPTGVLGFFNEWGTELAGVTLLMLVLMIAARNRRAKQAAEEEWDEGEVDMLAIPAAPQAIQQPRPASPPPVAKAAAPRPAAAVHRPTAPAPAPTSVAKPKAFAPPPPPPPPALEPELPAEPHDQSLELAEIMLSMGLGHGAAQTLTEQIRSEPKEALRHWLMLLEVYRQNGEQEEFERSAEELRLHFNVQPEDWNARPEDRPTLENYPHIAARVVELWGTPAGLTYLQNLLDDNRGGARAGFPQAVAEELLVLTHILMANGVVAEALALA